MWSKHSRIRQLRDCMTTKPNVNTAMLKTYKKQTLCEELGEPTNTNMDDYDYDDRCDGEQREADIWNAAEDGCERLGIPFDPVAEGLIEEEEEGEA